MTDLTATPATASDSRPAERDPGPAALVVSGVRKRFGAAMAVDGVDLVVGEHEVVCLVGPSGCGKSTVLRMVAGLVRPDQGEIRLGARLLDGPSTAVAPEQRGIGIVFQDHALFPNLTVAGNVAFGLNRLDRASRRRQVDAMLDLVGLGRHADRYPHELSGGERQRVALARALAPEPAVLLLDEPFASLDHNLRIQVRAEVLRILRTTGTPSVFVTHDQQEALALGDRVVVLRDGRVEQEGTPEEVFHAPRNRFVATFMGDADFVPASVAEGLVRSELGARPLPAGAPVGPVEMMLRPDDVTFETDPGGTAIVEWQEFQGSSVLYGLRLASGEQVRARRSHSVTVPTGTAVRPSLSAHHLFPVLLAADPTGS
jgi:iron(III) transport system ATP-binding protein